MEEINLKLVIDKIRQLFPSSDVEEATAILDDYGSERYHYAKTLVQLAALKMSNGKLNRLRNYMKTAREDFRDVLIVAREPNQFRIGMLRTTQPREEEQKTAKRKDEEQWEAWLHGNHFKVCENCSGVGIVVIQKENSAPSWDVGWRECSVCDGTGTQFPVER